MAKIRFSLLKTAEIRFLLRFEDSFFSFKNGRFSLFVPPAPFPFYQGLHNYNNFHFFLLKIANFRFSLSKTAEIPFLLLRFENSLFSFKNGRFCFPRAVPPKVFPNDFFPMKFFRRNVWCFNVPIFGHLSIQ